MINWLGDMEEGESTSGASTADSTPRPVLVQRVESGTNKYLYNQLRDLEEENRKYGPLVLHFKVSLIQLNLKLFCCLKDFVLLKIINYFRFNSYTSFKQLNNNKT